MATNVVQMRQKGGITLPVELRRRYGMREGDTFTVVDMGDGSVMLIPGVSEVARLGDEVAAIMAEEGVSLDDILKQLDEEREIYYQEHYAKATSVSGQ
jgi:AbrB family looped-hinge helix DNA binding protein